MVPEGWRLETLGELATVTSGGTPSRNNNRYWGGGIPWVTTAEINYATILGTAETISEAGLRSSAAKLFPKGTILVAMYGQGKTRGKVARLGVSATTNQACAALLPSPKYNSDFLYQYLAANYESMRSLSNDGSQKNLSGSLIKSITIRLPPLPEQRKIAEILSTWDEAIETTEKRLANAEAQKRALIQQLLTGKRRLKGFEGAWVNRPLSNVAQIIVSNVDKKMVAGEQPVRLCNYMDVYSNDIVHLHLPLMEATATPAQIKRFGLRVGDVLITKDSETPDDIAVPAYVSATADDFVCGYHLAIVRPRAGTSGRFLKFYFELPHTRYYFASRANGATRFGLTIAAMEGAPISLPSFGEQERIAEVIEGTEMEAERLEATVEKFRAEKAALMQQLLTGKRRVKVRDDLP